MRVVIAYLLAMAFTGLSTHARAQELPAMNESRVALTGQKTRVLTQFHLNPDCSATGPLTLRIIKLPSQGKIEQETGKWPPGFKQDAPRASCNDKMVDGVAVHYTSNENYTGLDEFEVELFTVTGQSKKIRIRVTVK